MKRKTLLSLMLFCFAYFGVANAEIVEIGDPNSTTSSWAMPVCTYYNYSFVQQIYRAEEIGTAGTITSIAFNYIYNGSGSSGFSMDNVMVFMKNYPPNQMPSQTEPMSDEDLVWQGTFSCISDWGTIILSTPFEYDGTSDLMVCFYDPTNGYPGSSHQFRTTLVQPSHIYSTYYGTAYYNDASPYNYEQQYNAMGSIEYRANIRIDITSGLTCHKPTNRSVSNVTAHEATLSWVSDSDAWQIMLNDDEDNLIDVTENSYTLTGLSPETTYTAKVRTICGSEDVSAWTSPLSFTTDVACPIPSGLAVDCQGTDATITWSSDASAFNIDINGEITEGVTSPYTIHGLETGMTYTVKVQADCGAEDGTSEWISTTFFSFGIPLIEEFGTDIPNGWSQYTGLLANVLDGSATLSPTTYGWYFGSYNGVFDSHAYADIYGNSCQNWLVLPTIVMENNVQLSFEVAYTSHYSDVPYQDGSDDKFVVLITTDGGTTWEILRQWDNAGSNYVLNDLNSAPLMINIDLSSYAGQNTAVAFYVESSIFNSDNILHIDNVSIAHFTPSLFTMEITGFGNSNNGWRLIASPLANEIDPAEIEGMTDGVYDLYAFEQAAELEWQNYKIHLFNLESGKGYLYAHDTDVTLTFTGTPYNNNGEVVLTKTEGVNFEGWNLVGNPFGQIAFLDCPFYVMNEDGSEIIVSEGHAVNPMEGIFVIAENDGDILAFSTEAPDDAEKSIILNVSHADVASSSSTAIDRAVIRFGESGSLPKFMLNDEHTKLYIPQNGTDYAVVNAENKATMPICLKVSEEGNYTLSVSFEGIEMDYLHLIDNLTGDDIDLLATPSYTFSATIGDNALRSRFTIVFDETTGIRENIAFISNGNIIIPDADAETTVQIVDVTGRVIICRDAARHVSTAGMTPGVYVVRLISGNDVKTQKIVVK